METWKPIADFEDRYEVSDLGRVRSLISDCVINPYLRGNYLCVTLHRSGKRVVRAVHHVVLETFVSARPEGLVGAHLDGVRTHNSLANLAWVTPAENEAHKVAHGTSGHGRPSTQAKLSDVQASIVREASELGLALNKISVLAGISLGSVQKIVRGERYVR